MKEAKAYSWKKGASTSGCKNQKTGKTDNIFLRYNELKKFSFCFA